MLCVSVAVNTKIFTAYARMVMTIREKFADLRSLVSKYKDNRMVLSFFYIGENGRKKESGYSQNIH